MRIAGLLAAAALLAPPFSAAEDSEAGHRLYKQIDRELEASSRAIGRLKQCYAQRRKALAEFDREAGAVVAELRKPRLADSKENAPPPPDPKGDGFRKCMREFTMEQALIKPDPADIEKGLVAIDYFHCMALAAGPAKPCAQLRRLGKLASKKMTYQQICEEFTTRAGVIKRIIDKSPEAEEACVAEMNRYAPADVDKPRFCGPLAKHASYDVICGAAKTDQRRNECLQLAGLFLGDPKSCSDPAADPFTRDTCQLSVAYKKAKAQGSSKACGENAMCAALMGDGPPACEKKYWPMIADAYCAARHPRPFDFVAADYRKTMESLAKADQEKQKTLKGAPPAGGDAEVAAQQLRDTKKKAIDASCDPAEKDLRAKLDQLGGMIDSVEPKSTVGLDDRQARFREVQQAYEAARKAEYASRPRIKTSAPTTGRPGPAPGKQPAAPEASSSGKKPS